MPEPRRHRWWCRFAGLVAVMLSACGPPQLNLPYTATLPEGFSLETVWTSQDPTDPGWVGAAIATDAAAPVAAGIYVIAARSGTGRLGDPAALADYEIQVLESAAVNLKVIERATPDSLDGRLVQRVTLEYDYALIPGQEARMRIREQSLYTRVASNLYTISFLCPAQHWSAKRPGFDSFLDSFRWAGGFINREVPRSASPPEMKGSVHGGGSSS